MNQIGPGIRDVLTIQGEVYRPEEGDYVAVMSTLDPGAIKYAVYTTVRGEAELRMLWLDTLCLPHLTGSKAS